MAFTKATFTTPGSRTVAIGCHIPPANPNGRKHIPVLFYHGGGERGAGNGDITTSEGIDKVANYSLPKLVRDTTNMGTFTPAGGDPNEGVRIAVFFMQLPITDNPVQWNQDYTLGALPYLKTTYSNECDFTKLCITGISLGGGGCLHAIQNATIAAQVATCIPICPWYENWNSTTLLALSKNCPAIYIFHAASDPTALKERSYNFVNGLNPNKPTWPAQLIMFKGTDTPNKGFNGHQIGDVLYNYTNRNEFTELVTGDIWTKKNYLYEIMPLHTTNRYVKP